MADEFDGSILEFDTCDLLSGNATDDEVLADEVREKIYREELAEVERLKEALWSKHESMAGRALTPEARTRGLQILDQKLAVVEARYRGLPLPTFERLEPIGQETVKVKPVKVKPKVGPRWEAKAAGLKYYIPTRACKRGHSKRLTSTGACVECSRKANAVKNVRRRARRLAAATV